MHQRILRRAALLLCVFSVLLPGRALAARTTPPNVVLIIADDLGWPHMGFMGHPFVETPSLDALAAGGTVFTSAHNTASTCIPSLRALLGGLHSDQWDAKKAALDPLLGPIPVRRESVHYRTLPRELARRGYLSWEGGKMWEGTFLQAGFTHGLATEPGGPLFVFGENFGREGWSEGTALAPLQSFLDEAADAPFFLWVAPMLPHTPYDAPAEFRAPYEGLGLSSNEVLYYANVSWLDAVVGAVVAEIDARGLRDDTLILLVSDNGTDPPNPLAGFGRAKGTLYELGFRTPLVLNWPGRIDAGVTRDDLVSTLDIPATILDYAGADADEPLGNGGRSLRTAVENGAPVGRDKIVSGYGGALPQNEGFFVRTPTWRYITAADGSEKLFAIAIDPLEAVDVAAQHPELLPGFRADVAAWRQQLVTALAELQSAGRLTDAQSRPMPGEEIQLVGRTSAHKALRLRVQTSTNGEFFFRSVPQGAYKLRSRGSAKLTFGPYRGLIPVGLPVAATDSYVALRGVPPSIARTAGTSTLSGVVRSSTGEPVPGALVTLSGRAERRIVVAVRTAANGRYRAESLPAALYKVAVKPAARQLGRARGEVQVAVDDDATLDLTTTGP